QGQCFLYCASLLFTETDGGAAVTSRSRNLLGYLPGHVTEAGSNVTIGLSHYAGATTIHLFPNRQGKRKASQYSGVVLCRNALPASSAKDRLLMAALRTSMKAHVLDHSQHRDLDLTEHFYALTS